MRHFALLSSTLLLCASASLLSVACQSTASTEKDAPSSSEADVPTGDATKPSASADAGAPDATDNAAASDDGAVDDTDPRVAIFNRIIVKFAEGAPKDVETVKAAVEQHTGAKVDRIHLGPIGTAVVIFAPVSPPRDQSAQTDLAKSLADLSTFAYAEADRLRGPR